MDLMEDISKTILDQAANQITHRFLVTINEKFDFTGLSRAFEEPKVSVIGSGVLYIILHTRRRFNAPEVLSQISRELTKCGVFVKSHAISEMHLYKMSSRKEIAEIFVINKPTD